MKDEREQSAISRKELITKTPWLIQRCQLNPDEQNLIYEYMGSTEFEIGDQAKSLKRIFAEGMTTFKVTVHTDHNDSLPFYLVAGKEFNSRLYPKVINGLVEGKFRIKEYTQLRETVNMVLGKKRYEEDDKFLKTNVWFDFANDVLFTPYQQLSDKIIPTLEKIKIKWETPDPPHIQTFKKEVEKVKEELRAKGVRWFFLGDLFEKNGKLLAWFNDGGEHSGWYTLEQLRAWDGKGKVPRRVIHTNK